MRIAEAHLPTPDRANLTQPQYVRSPIILAVALFGARGLFALLETLRWPERALSGRHAEA
jgi:hypothetical protein